MCLVAPVSIDSQSPLAAARVSSVESLPDPFLITRAGNAGSAPTPPFGTFLWCGCASRSTLRFLCGSGWHGSGGVLGVAGHGGARGARVRDGRRRVSQGLRPCVPIRVQNPCRDDVHAVRCRARIRSLLGTSNGLPAGRSFHTHFCTLLHCPPVHL